MEKTPLMVKIHMRNLHFGLAINDLGIKGTIDLAVKRFLKKAWRNRKALVLQTNKIFDRNDTPWAIYSHGDGLSTSYNKNCGPAPARQRRGKAGTTSKS